MLSEKVKENKADIGLSLDGDGDRLIICDENGEVIDGDQILGLIALQMKENGMLKNDEVVGTLMTNVGLEKKLEDNSIGLIRAPVGDRYVKEEMLKRSLLVI